MKSYDSLIKYLFNLSRKDSYLKLQEMTLLNEAFNYPVKQFKSIHIAGTNGKGSVSYKIAKALALSGYKTALFTSPHISCFRERIIINDKMISKEQVVKILSQIIEKSHKLNVVLTYFEAITLIAFIYFAKKKVDFAVIETGLGGRLDATNIITPILSIITSISYDHVNILGKSLDKIAQEKAGIIKPNIPIILGPSANREVIRKIAKEKNAPVFLAKENRGFYDDHNQEIAKRALRLLSKEIQLDEKAISKALLVRPKCRFEKIKVRGGSPFILDVAHNEDGLRALKKAINKFYPHRKVRVLLNLSKGRDIKKCLRIITSFAAFIEIVEINHYKLHDGIFLKKLLRELGFKNFEASKDISELINRNISEAKKNNEIILACGSFYIMRDIRKALKIKEIRDKIDLNEKK